MCSDLSVMCNVISRGNYLGIVTKKYNTGSLGQPKVGSAKVGVQLTSICLDSDIRKALVNKEGLVAIFLDIEKAYDVERGIGHKTS